MAGTDIQALEAKTASWKQTGKDLGSGAAGGIAQVLLGESDRKRRHWTLADWKEERVRARKRERHSEESLGRMAVGGKTSP